MNRRNAIAYPLLILLPFVFLLVIVAAAFSVAAAGIRKNSESVTLSSAEILADSISDGIRNGISPDIGSFCADPESELFMHTLGTSADTMTAYVYDKGSGNVFGFDANGSCSLLINGLSAGLISEFSEECGIVGTPSEVSPDAFCASVSAVMANGEISGYVIVASAGESFRQFRNAGLISAAIILLWAALALLIVLAFLRKNITRPLQQLRQAASEYAEGRFKGRVSVPESSPMSELASNFNAMAQSLEALETMRNDFVSSVSHDMRTPMTSIAGFIDCILDGAVPREKEEEYLRFIKDEVMRLSRLVKNLLDISRIQAGDRKFENEPFNISEICRQVILSFEKKIEEKQLDVDFDIPDRDITACGDCDAINQVIYNLSDNAVKFSKNSGLLRIKLRQNGGEVSFSVFNEGDGIPEEDRQFIFDRFFKGDRTRGKDRSGVGLGLYICKTIINAHGGSIGVSGETGRNCEFYFTIPAAKRQGNPAARHAKGRDNHE